MNKTLTTKLNFQNRKTALVLILLVLVFVVLTLTQDFLRADLKNSAFYFSESLLFSSFWWLFAPLLFAQYFVVRYKNRKALKFQAVLIILPILIHLFAFPLLVMVLSKLFYYHTFSFQQTFRYTLSEHLYLLTVFYSVPVLTFQFFLRNAKPAAPSSETQTGTIENKFISNIIVSEGNKKQSILVSEIYYFSANPPYINLHLENKKFLYTETLKFISSTLNPSEFVRVHKSTIVNIKMVVSYTTRLNGDYDLKMKNNVNLRLSRNFSTDFKMLFNKTHRVTTK